MRSPWVRAGFLVLCAAIAAITLYRDRHQAAHAISELGPWALLLALGFSVADVLLTGLAWRAALADLGSRLPLRVAARVFCVGALGKYVPGSVWQLLAQTELGRDHGVPRRRTATALVLQMLVAVATALLVCVIALPISPPEVADRFGWAVALTPVLLALMAPPVLNRLLGWALRRLRRPALEHDVSTRGVLANSGWSVLSWLMAGLQVYVLVVGFGGHGGFRTGALAIGGYGLAWSVGFLVVFAPAGAGAREAALGVVLAPVVDHGTIIVLVLASRVLFTIADFGLAGVAIVLTRRQVGTLVRCR